MNSSNDDINLDTFYTNTLIEKMLSNCKNEARDEYDTNTNTQDNSMICKACYSTILSKTHADKCNTISMYQIKESVLDDNFKPMMTYGLCGCTAFIMINKNNKKIIFAHHPDYKMIKLFFINNYNCSDEFIVILKTPGSYVKEIVENLWKLKSINEQIEKTDFNKPNVKLNIVPYNLSHMIGNIYNSELYCKYLNNKFIYTDSIGVNNYIDL
jgi:hypothetical protein